MSSFVSMNVKVRQGCILVLSLLNIYIDWVLVRVVDQNNYGTSGGNIKVTDFDFADDAATLAESLEVQVTVLQGLFSNITSWDDGVDATGMGVVHAITPDGKLSISHDPIPALGWPAMKMDMDVAGLDTSAIPLDTPVEFDLAQGEDGLYVIIGVRAEGASAEIGKDAMPDMQKAASAPPLVVDGVVRSVDIGARQATIAHGPIAEIGMPGMMMAFDLADDVDPASLPLDQDLVLTFARPDGMTMILTAFETVARPMKVMGIVNSIDLAAGTANVTHGPIAEIGMPGMTMDFPLDAALDPASLPLGEETGLLLTQGQDMSLTLKGLSEGGS